MDGARGFTLIELLVTLVLLAVVGALVYPSYGEAVLRVRRNEGQVALTQLMAQQERYFTLHNTYLAFSAQSFNPEEQAFKWWSGSQAATSAYELQGQACPQQRIADCIELRATPGTRRVDEHFHDDDCKVLILSSTGQRSATGDATRCWP